jgi:hypothetical protein
MKYVRVVLSFLCIGVTGAFAEPQIAHAETIYSSEQTITVTATVLEHRTIIVDASGKIIQISSNTENNLTPDVRFLSYGGAKGVLTLDLSHQYQHLMSQVQANHMFVMDGQAEVLAGFMPQALLPISHRSFLVSPAHIGDGPNSSYTIYE